MTDRRPNRRSAMFLPALQPDRIAEVVAAGADIVVFDPATIAPDLPELVHDLPTGAARIRQRAIGIKETIVGGQVLLRGHEHTCALPGKLLRSTRAAA